MSGLAGKTSPAELVKRQGGRYAGALRIDLAAPDAGDCEFAAGLGGRRNGQAATSFADFESALVREGLRLRRQASRRHVSA